MTIGRQIQVIQQGAYTPAGGLSQFSGYLPGIHEHLGLSHSTR